MTTLLKSAKRLARKSDRLVSLWDRWLELQTVPKQDLANPFKMNIMLTVKQHSMLSFPRLSRLYDLASPSKGKTARGSYVECGVWNGGSAGIIAAASRLIPNRQVWLFDSWEGLPEPTDLDVSYLGEKGTKGLAKGSEDEVRKLLFDRLSLDERSIHMIKGWYSDSVPANRVDVGKIALLHLDCDWYESVKLCLNQLYDQVIPAGIVVFDDYGYWRGCKKAVDEFIRERDLRVELVQIDESSVYLQKPSS